MHNRNIVRGLVLMAVAILFGAFSFRYKLGEFSRAGPGLFPLMVSCILGFIGLITVVRAFFLEPVPLSYSAKNVVLVLLGLCGFAVLSQYVNMIVGIIFMVFVSSFAGTSYSVMRNVKVSAGLIAVSFGFQYLLGLQLPLL